MDVALCDTTPRQLLRLAGHRLHSVDRQRFARFRPGPGIFKVDYALSEPIPWRAKDCALAATVHVGGDDAEIAASESAVVNGRTATRPFLIVVQPSLFDASRAPLGRHTAWAYCHVPNGSTEDMLPRIEAQMERFAPGFRECVLARRVFPPADLEYMDRNLEGGDISWRRGRWPAALPAARLALLCHQRSLALSLLRLDAARRRGAWHVRPQRGADGAAASAKIAAQMIERDCIDLVRARRSERSEAG